MTNRQFKKCIKTIEEEKANRNVTDLYVDLDKFSIRCTDIDTYRNESGANYEMFAKISFNGETISIIDISLLKNVRYTDCNQETFPIIV